MKRFGWLISRYLAQAIVPYFMFSWLLLSVILFVQQASRFSDIFFSVNIPAKLVWQLMIALIPSVIAFTCPMAILVGAVIGLSKMQGDSELVAIRAAGVSNLQITVPVILLGILLSLFAFFVNLEGVPIAARLVRGVALQTAIQKLESPIEPGVFNTEVAGYTIYVKGRDIANGRWNNIFVYNEDQANGILRLITSQRGRIDLTDQASELVLENASVSTFPKEPGQGKYISENIGEIRLAIKTKRSELIEKLSKAEGTPEELGLSQLSEYAASKEGSDRIEAQILWQRRIILSLSPLIFCLFGASLILRFNRGGRGFGIFVALISLIAYFLFAFLGEQLARVGKISVFEGGMIPLLISLFVILWFNFSSKLIFWNNWSEHVRIVFARLKRSPEKIQTRNVFVDVTTGIRDFDLVGNLIKYFFLTLGFLGSVFIIFTAFELWKFAGAFDGGLWLLIKYLFFLLPFIYLQLAPSAAMIGTLVTYVIKSRQNEIVTWTSAGQSVYRLLVPCFLLMLLLGFANWQIQENLLPKANQIQDMLRLQIRGRGVSTLKSGKYWIANEQRIYSFELPSLASDNDKVTDLSMVDKNSAFDNEKTVSNLNIYQFDNKSNLQFTYRAKNAIWQSDRIVFIGNVEISSLADGRISTETKNGGELMENSNPFKDFRKKPSHLTTTELKMQLEKSYSDVERLSFAVALEKKYSTLFLPIIIALFTAPFALSLSRKGKVVTIGFAIALWLLFMGVTNVFEQFGLNGYLSPVFAVWGPLVVFSMLGIYLLSKIRT